MMSERLENKCRTLIEEHKYVECEKVIVMSMIKMPHSAVPHNLMGILLEKEHNHILAMRHFRAAYGLDPAYVPARYNLDHYGEVFPTGLRQCAYTEEDCPVTKDSYLNM